MGLTLGTAAAYALQAPKAVWIGVAVLAGCCFVIALWLHIWEGRTPTATPRHRRAPEPENPYRRRALEQLKGAEQILERQKPDSEDEGPKA